MENKLRIWRVVPTSKTGVQAPSYFVETTEYVREKAEKVAIKMAKEKSALSNYDSWNFRVSKIEKRKEKRAFNKGGARCNNTTPYKEIRPRVQRSACTRVRRNSSRGVLHTRRNDHDAERHRCPTSKHSR